jgi:hypothetical protein
MAINHPELPDYDLAETQSFGPRSFYRTDLEPKEKESRKIILVLSLIFNDMKDLIYMHRQLNKGACKSKKINCYLGQWTGMQEHAFRMLMSTFREVLATIQANRDIFESQEMFRALKKLNPTNRKRWDELRMGMT